jgi:hypothetical protein
MQTYLSDNFEEYKGGSIIPKFTYNTTFMLLIFGQRLS